MANTRNRLQKYFEEIEKSRAQRDRECEVYELGYQTGRRWLSVFATVHQAGCLELFREHLEAAGQWEQWFAAEPTNPFTIAERWHFNIIDPLGASEAVIDLFGSCSERIPRTPDRSRSAKFWKLTGATIEQLSSGDFLRGFSEGALQTWSCLKSETRETD